MKNAAHPAVKREEEEDWAVTSLLLKRASASRTSGEWNDDDFDVLTDGVVVGRITPWMWMLAFGADALCDRLRLLTARLGWNTEDSRRVL